MLPAASVVVGMNPVIMPDHDGENFAVRNVRCRRRRCKDRLVQPLDGGAAGRPSRARAASITDRTRAAPAAPSLRVAGLPNGSANSSADIDIDHSAKASGSSTLSPKNSTQVSDATRVMRSFITSMRPSDASISVSAICRVRWISHFASCSPIRLANDLMLALLLGAFEAENKRRLAAAELQHLRAVGDAEDVGLREHVAHVGVAGDDDQPAEFRDRPEHPEESERYLAATTATSRRNIGDQRPSAPRSLKSNASSSDAVWSDGYLSWPRQFCRNISASTWRIVPLPPSRPP